MISRSDIIKILRSWEDGVITAKEVWEWANEIYFPGSIEFDDWEGENENENSVANEVMRALDFLGIDPIVSENIPIYIEFLNTQEGQFDKGYQKWSGEIDKIDFKERRKRLKNHELYGQFCK